MQIAPCMLSLLNQCCLQNQAPRSSPGKSYCVKGHPKLLAAVNAFISFLCPSVPTNVHTVYLVFSCRFGVLQKQEKNNMSNNLATHYSFLSLLYNFGQFGCHGSQGQKFSNIFEPITGHRGDFSILKTSHKISRKWFK